MASQLISSVSAALRVGDRRAAAHGSRGRAIAVAEKRQVNPWSWQERLGYSQAWRVDGSAAIIFLAGQGPVSEAGELVGEGDFDAQVRQTFENIRTVLEQAGLPWTRSSSSPYI